MTWPETRQRTRIIREVAAVAATDMSGTLPWREEWAAHFDDRAELVAALRSRWSHLPEAQAQQARGRLRRSDAAILRILARAESGSRR